MTLRTFKYCVITIFAFLLWQHSNAQQRRSVTYIDFRVNSSEIEPDFCDNASRLQEITSILDEIRTDSTICIQNISFCGTASPEGSYQLNKKLSESRMEALEKIVLNEISVPDSLITRESGYIPWDFLTEMVKESDISGKKRILEILNGESELVNYGDGQKIDSRILKLKELNGGVTWREMNRSFFSRMRNACVIFVTYKDEASGKVITTPVTIEKPAEKPETRPDTTAVAAVNEPSPEKVSDGWCHRFTIKTNFLGLGLAIANAGLEIDICRHLSLNLPAYYSAWNYFREDVKFRTLSAQPELRFWFSKKNDGFFLGGHFGYGWYNVATGGEYRIQDHDGESPAVGGGLTLGYRVPISRSGNWKLEFTVGGGYYDLHQDYFRNYHNGLLSHTEKKTYIGPDQASISISYSFDLKRDKAKKEGRR